MSPQTGEPAPAADGRGRRRLGHYLTVVGIVGVIASIATIITAGRMVAVFDDDLQASTEVTVQAIDAASESVEVLESLVETLNTQSGPVVAALRNTAEGIDSSMGAVDSATELADDEIPASLAAIADVFPALEAAAGAVDLALSGLSELPIGPDYDPDVGLDEAIADIGNRLDELAASVDRASSEFVDVSDALEQAPADLRDVADAIEQLDEGLQVDDLIAEYDATLEEARRVAVDSLDNVDTGSDWLVAAVIVMAIVFGLGQAGLAGLGRHLAATTPVVTVDRSDPPPADRPVSSS